MNFFSIYCNLNVVQELEFTAQKNLRKEAFLRVYHSDKKGVSAWEEVKKEEFESKKRN
jgi:uncharacterized protein YxeA